MDETVQRVPTDPATLGRLIWAALVPPWDLTGLWITLVEQEGIETTRQLWNDALIHMAEAEQDAEVS